MYVAIGQRIRKARHDKLLTQESLAEKAGISASFLGHIERGSRIASIETLVRLANALDIDANALLSNSLRVMRAEGNIGPEERKARIIAVISAALDAYMK